METFSIVTRITKRQFQRISLRLTYQRPLIVIATVLGLISGFVAAAYLLDKVHLEDFDPTIYVMFGSWVILVPIISWLRASKIYGNSPVMHKEANYTFDDEGLSYTSDEFSGSFKWNAFTRRQEVGDFILLYVGSAMALLLNKASFTAGQLEDVRRKVPLRK